MLKKRWSFLFPAAVTLSVVCIASGFGLPSVSDVTGIELPKDAIQVTLLPSQVHEGFSSLDESNPFELDSLTYLQTEMPNYDEFFLQAARLRGTIQLTHHTLQMIQTVTDTEMLAAALQDEEFLNTIEDSELHDTITALKIFIPATFDGLEALPATVTELVSMSTNLVSSAPSDFAGVNIVHLPMIIEELGSTVELISGLPVEATSLLSEIQAAIPNLNI
ncbi:MAG: hypothetical protein KAH54_07055 [Candidatus Sabulitectum sp.]|nr:hypothetical protein [Candidatus Sabulitectum sp.]